MTLDTPLLTDTHHTILKKIGEDTCKFFDQATFHFSASTQYPALFDLDIIPANGSCISLTSWCDEDSATIVIGFGDENSVFQRLRLTPVSHELYEYQRDNLCFFIDGVIARMIETESMTIN